MHNCFVTGGILISFQISRSTGVFIATAYLNYVRPGISAVTSLNI